MHHVHTMIPAQLLPLFITADLDQPPARYAERPVGGIGGRKRGHLAGSNAVVLPRT
jgi:hypothetical protein